jgi:hypothetical protein
MIHPNGEGLGNPARRTELSIRLSLLDEKTGTNQRRCFLAVITRDVRVLVSEMIISPKGCDIAFDHNQRLCLTVAER